MTDTALQVEGDTTPPGRHIPEWLIVLGVAVLAAVVYTIPFLFQHAFYYVGDNPESFVPLWYHFGEQLRAGQWPTMDPNGWYGGNYAGDAAYSLWNPVTLLNYLVVSTFNDLASGAAFVVVEFLTLLSVGSYLLSREYGARVVPSAVIALAVPGTGFTLYYEAAGWPAGLMAFTWVVWFWWSARRFARGRLMPLVPFLFGVLAMTTGNPYATLGLIIVLLGIGVELLLRRDLRRFWQLVVMGACVGASLALVFLPLLGSLSVSSRQQLAMIANDGFMVPDFGDLAAGSSPSYLPSIINWGGAIRESLPSTYFIWFAVPLLPWLRWRALREQRGGLISLGVVTAIYGVLVVGPSNLWLFRWPIRLIEYCYVGLAVLLAVLLSAGLARDRIRQRAVATAALVGMGFYLSSAVRPEYYRMHLLTALIVLVLVAAAIWVYQRRGWVGAGAVLMVGTIGVLTYQSAKIPVRGPGPGFTPPHLVSRMTAGTAQYQGTVLQLADQDHTPISTEDMADGQIMFGNETVAAHITSINRYSGIGFAKFADALCISYKGVTCPQAYDKLFATVPDTDIPLIDALRVQTLVLQNYQYPYIVDRDPPAGWRLLQQDDVRTVWVRDTPLRYPGRVSYASPGVRVASADSTASSDRIAYTAPDGGRLILAGLAWPGYTASVDGKPVEVEVGEAGLITLSVPAGQHVLDVDFTTPGLRLGWFMLIAATAVMVLFSAWWTVTTLRSRRRPAELAATPAEPADEHPEDALTRA